MQWQGWRSQTATVEGDTAAMPVAKRPRLVQTLLLFCVLALTALGAQPATAQLGREGVAIGLRATVQVIVPDPAFENFSLGSGTVVSPEGLILTNYHVVEGDRPNGLMNDDGLAGIALTPPDLRGEAVLKYVGIVVRTDEDLDLALVQIVGLIDDPEAPLPANLGLTPIEFGNSDELLIGDEIHIFGFPGLGGNTPTYTRGTVSGFEDEDRNGVFEWIKTDAEISSGNSGGLATDDRARLIGVPTQVRYSDVGKIGKVRTGNLAVDFVNGYFPNQGGSSARVTDVQYAQSINRRGLAVNPAEQFPEGTTDLYAVFSYSGFQDNLPLVYVWYRDGVEIARDSFAWDGGESGTSWVSLYNDDGLTSGFTELQLILDGQSLYRGGVTVGSGTPPRRNDSASASFGPITFAEDVANDRPVGTAVTFSGVQEVYAFFDYQGMRDGLDWQTRWYYNNQMVLETPNSWQSGESGSYYVSLYHPDGLPTGQYKLELYIDGRMVRDGTFAVQDAGPRPPRDVGLIGVVVDSNNSRTGVSGALVVFLQPGYTVDQWASQDFPDSMIHGMATSNRSGNFQLSTRVVPGEYYSVVVVHDNYFPITVDNFQIPADATDPHEITATMDPY